jgi:hypothetical protein
VLVQCVVLCVSFFVILAAASCHLTKCRACVHTCYSCICLCLLHDCCCYAYCCFLKASQSHYTDQCTLSLSYHVRNVVLSRSDVLSCSTLAAVHLCIYTTTECYMIDCKAVCQSSKWYCCYYCCCCCHLLK